MKWWRRWRARKQLLVWLARWNDICAEQEAYEKRWHQPWLTSRGRGILHARHSVERQVIELVGRL